MSAGPVTLWLPPPEFLPLGLEELARADPPVELSVAPVVYRLPSRQERYFDRYFGVGRAVDAPGPRLVGALHCTIAAIDRGPALDEILTGALALAGLATFPGEPPASSRSGAPILRWIHGHRLFFVLLQITCIALRQACRRPDAHPDPEASAAAAALLRCCAAAMRATAGFSPKDYADSVRPTMQPPDLPHERFSALWSADHRALIRHLRHWGARHATTCHDPCPALGELRLALEGCLTAHEQICARFVGARCSLLGADDSTATLRRLTATRRRLL